MDDETIDLRAILGVLRRHVRLIIAVIVTVLIVAGGVVYALKPQYTATSLVFVDTARKNLLESDLANMSSSAADNARVDSEVEIVRSIPTFLRVIEDAQLLTDPEFMPRIGMRDQLMAFFRLGTPALPTGEEAINNLVTRLQSSVSVQRRGLTYLISINATAGSPATASKIANAVADAYIALQVESKTESVMNSLDRLEPRIAEATATLASSEGAFDGFVESNIERLATQTNNQAITDLRQQLQDATARRTTLSDQVENASRSLAQQDYNALASSLQSQAVAQLETQRTELLNRIEALEPNSTAAVDLRGSLAQIESDLRETAGAEISSLRGQVDTYQTQADGLRDQVRQTFFSSELPPDLLAEIFQLQQNATLAQTSYEQLLARVNDLRTQADLQLADSRVVAAATPPSSASFPNTRLILIMAFLAAAGLGVGLAFVVDNFVGGFTSQEQLESVTRREVAASIPLQKQIKREDGSPSPSAADTIIQAPLSQYSESIRRLRLRLDQVMDKRENPTEGARVILVTSSLPIEGKTTTALALARTYALSGQRVLIIDGDLRKPSMHKHLGVASEIGLLEYLSGSSTPEVSKDPMTDLRAVLNATRSTAPVENLLSSKGFSALIQAARKAYDVVIIDTAPAGVVVDGVYLLQFADAVLFVARYASTTQRDVTRTLNVIDRANANSLPVVMAMTQQPSKMTGYSARYQYGYYTEA